MERLTIFQRTAQSVQTAMEKRKKILIVATVSNVDGYGNLFTVSSLH
jgi:hypothetical protein